MNFIFFSLGIIFFQLFYILLNYFLTRQIEYLYFVIACLFLTIFCVLRIFPDLNPYHLHPGEEVFSSLYGLVFIGFGMYYRFIRYFMDLALYYPRVNKAFLISESIVTGVGFLVIVLGSFSLQPIAFQIFRACYTLALPFNIVLIIYLGTRRKKLNTIILVGTLLAMAISRGGIIQYVYFKHAPFPLQNFQIILVSIMVLILFMTFGLVYKSRLIQIKNFEMEIQKQLELSQQRAAISANLHDDLGASISSIQLNAIMAQKSIEDDIPKTKANLTKMVNDLHVVMENMGDIIWAINTDGPAQKPISAQIKDFYFELMDMHNIQCAYHLDDDLEVQITDIHARKNLLLIIKEAVNNILKHAKASQIDITLRIENNQLLLEIKDNGIGLPEIKPKTSGYGLGNMQFRTEKLKGVFTISSIAGIGTTISCLIPLTNIRYMIPRGI